MAVTPTQQKKPTDTKSNQPTNSNTNSGSNNSQDPKKGQKLDASAAKSATLSKDQIISIAMILVGVILIAIGILTW